MELNLVPNKPLSAVTGHVTSLPTHLKNGSTMDRTKSMEKQKNDGPLPMG